MDIVLGATGHVGSAVASALLDARRPVTVVTHDDAHAASLRERGATVAVVDIHDVDALRRVLKTGRRAFLLNPPARPSTDTDTEERRTVRCILDALDGSGLEGVVAASAYGAQPGERIGDLSVLYELEEGLRAQPVPATILRGAYYFSNWVAMLPAVRKDGKLHTMFPLDFEMAMVAPEDIGRAAARLLQDLPDAGSLRHVEGPWRYTPRDVAASFQRALGRSVEAVVVPREQWAATFEATGFSPEAAASFATMTAKVIEGPLDDPDAPLRGSTTLDDYLKKAAAAP